MTDSPISTAKHHDILVVTSNNPPVNALGAAVRQGLTAAIDHEPDVIIVDLMLPRRDGIRVIDELRSRGRSTPVLILSARRSVDDRVRGMKAGGDDYLLHFVEPRVVTENTVRHGLVV